MRIQEIPNLPTRAKNSIHQNLGPSLDDLNGRTADEVRELPGVGEKAMEALLEAGWEPAKEERAPDEEEVSELKMPQGGWGVFLDMAASEEQAKHLLRNLEEHISDDIPLRPQAECGAMRYDLDRRAKTMFDALLEHYKPSEDVIKESFGLARCWRAELDAAVEATEE